MSSTEDAEKPAVWQTLRTLPRPVKILLLGVALNRTGQFVQIFLVVYLTSIGVQPLRAGVLLTAFGIGSIVGVFLGGTLSDAFGLRRTIASSMLLSSVFIGSLAFVHVYVLLFFICAISGLLSQLYRPAAAAMLAEFTSTARLVIASAAYRFGLNIGASVGPLIGAFLITHSYQAVFLVNGGTCLVFGLVALLELPRMAARKRTERRAGSYLDLARDRAFVLVVLAQFVTSLAEVQYIALLPLEIHHRGLPEPLYGILLAINGILVLAIELPLTRYVQRMSIRTAITLGSGMIGLGVAAFGIPAGIWIFFAGTLVWTLGEIVSAPSVIAYPAMAAQDGLRGRYIGAMTGAQTAGYAVGPAVGTALYQFYGSSAWLLCAVLGVAAAVGMRIGVLGPTELRRRSKGREGAPMAD